MSVLRKQLEQYESIITSRIAPDQPVITYQDNMQIMRTSLRHLRLSKLHIKIVSKLKYVIELPKLKEEFPMLATEKSQVYPLPLSFENQCATMGAANNLNLFSEEFQFPCEPVERYLPMKKNSADFDVDAAYERYAFLKTLNKHKEKQARYENVLRKRGNDSSENVEAPDNTIIGFVDSDSETSENLSD